MKESGNTMYYFGDLDYEGIGIYESLAQMFPERWKIIPFVKAYARMLEKAGDVTALPLTKEGQNRNISPLFFSYFDRQTAEVMEHILQAERYIPQEILNISDL